MTRNQTSTITAPPSRLDWLGAAFAGGMGCVFLLGWLLDIQTFAWFLMTLAIDVVMTLMFLIWWFTRRSFSKLQRVLIFGCAIGLGLLVGRLSHHAIPQPAFLVLSGVPVLVAVWWGWYILTRRLSMRVRTFGLIACFAAAWGPFLLIRMSGYQGNLRADLHWRWTPTTEQIYLAQSATRTTSDGTTILGQRALELRPRDWPGFRGPHRDGVVRNLRISLDWSQSPPKVLWRQRVGPAWSSMAIVDGFVFTQEQRGEREAVVCRNALSGEEVWVHDDPVRFEEAMSGVGPRATPAFDQGRIYAQGTLGTLNCLEAASGGLIWSRDVRKDADAALPMWGFCNSPLVVEDRVIVFAGGEGKKGLLAYSAVDGHLLWTSDAGKMSYASPQVFDAPDGRAILIFTNEGFFSVDPPSGRIRWKLPIEQRVGLPAALEACLVAPDSIVLGNGAAFGAERIELSSNAAPTRKWVSQRLKPAFSDMVYHDGFIYGFDATVFCCVDAATGARRWRNGRFGAGQVLLLADQGVLIISSEDGQVILLKCNPERYEELGRLQAITGKTWNHPAVAGDRLYVRSDAEMACFQLHIAPGE